MKRLLLALTAVAGLAWSAQAADTEVSFKINSFTIDKAEQVEGVNNIQVTMNYTLTGKATDEGGVYADVWTTSDNNLWVPLTYTEGTNDATFSLPKDLMSSDTEGRTLIEGLQMNTSYYLYLNAAYNYSAEDEEYSYSGWTSYKEFKIVEPGSPLVTIDSFSIDKAEKVADGNSVVVTMNYTMTDAETDDDAFIKVCIYTNQYNYLWVPAKLKGGSNAITFTLPDDLASTDEDGKTFINGLATDETYYLYLDVWYNHDADANTYSSTGFTSYQIFQIVDPNAPLVTIDTSLLYKAVQKDDANLIEARVECTLANLESDKAEIVACFWTDGWEDWKETRVPVELKEGANTVVFSLPKDIASTDEDGKTLINGLELDTDYYFDLCIRYNYDESGENYSETSYTDYVLFKIEKAPVVTIDSFSIDNAALVDGANSIEVTMNYTIDNADYDRVAYVKVCLYTDTYHYLWVPASLEGGSKELKFNLPGDLSASDEEGKALIDALTANTWYYMYLQVWYDYDSLYNTYSNTPGWTDYQAFQIEDPNAPKLVINSFKVDKAVKVDGANSIEVTMNCTLTNKESDSAYICSSIYTTGWNELYIPVTLNKGENEVKFNLPADLESDDADGKKFIDSLELDTEYWMYLYVSYNWDSSTQSWFYTANTENESFTIVEDTSGVSSVLGDDADAEYYTLDGIRLNGSSLNSGIYVRKQGSKVSKVLVK